jgi:RNA polymerase primary sigma factor
VRWPASSSPADEVRLSLAIERGDRRAREEMITANLRLVWLLARRYRGLRVPFEDLVQEGTVGLVRAVDRFDHRRGAKFSTFAVWWIRRAMTEAVQGERTIRIPREPLARSPRSNGRRRSCAANARDRRAPRRSPRAPA